MKIRITIIISLIFVLLEQSMANEYVFIQEKERDTSFRYPCLEVQKPWIGFDFMGPTWTWHYITDNL